MATGYISEVFCSFQGEGLFAGRRHLFVRMAGCNLRCGYCDTPESLVRTRECAIYGDAGVERRLPNPLLPAELSELVGPFVESQVGLHALAITGGEPLMQCDFLAEWLRCACLPVPVLLETNGSYSTRLPAVLPFLEYISMDLKLPSNSGERDLWEEHRAFLEQSRAKIVYVKVPVDETTLDSELETAAELVADIAPEAPFFLQPIMDENGTSRIGPARLRRFYDVAVRHLADVRVMPQAHKVLGIL